ncbi:DUF2117 domain-containing protein [Methanolobus mangrovi]|uniref:DUF2117 domain-containing protein n=1 Tax=Methanolobus mangrovi TaxID=3072977 RepID=A0AA51YKE9_9EURY|nr:DUF2117 domain-containing protein [Methanolobus mangrovi]WMW23149.1 DUF2117 domain-containing protein [Methanolobus mangrovi]
MEIGVVIHGPDIVDSGMAKEMLDILKEYGNTSAIMAGTIGKTAVLDAHLEDIIDIRKSLKPSRCIEEFFLTKDIVILLNHGKTTNNGILFANIVVSRMADRTIKPLVHIERPGLPDGKIIPWNQKSLDFALKMEKVLDLEMTDVPELITPISVEDQGHRIIRTVYGVHIGEKIMINGIIVGFAKSEDIQIITENGFIKEIKGARVKEHGLEKLHGYNLRIPIDLNSCWVKSGPLRGNNFSVRKNVSESKYISNEGKSSPDSVDKIKAVIIDHEAERSFELVEGAQVAVTIGDDTTDVAGDILYRLRIPIIGITDGDIDGFSHNKHIYPGSTVLRLQPGSDDIVGKEIRRQIFDGKEFAYFDSTNILKNKIFTLANNLLIFSTDY